MRNLPLKIKIFLVSIYTITLISLLIFFMSGYMQNINIDYKNAIFFILLTALTETFTVAFRNISFSTSFSINLASFILFGPLIAIVISIIGFSLRILKVQNGYKHILNTPIYGTLSNYCVFILPILFGSLVYVILGGGYPVIGNNNILPIIAFCCTFFLINTFIISILFSINTHKKFIFCFINNVKLGFLNILAMAPFGIIIAVVFKQYNYIGVLLLLFPVVLARYTFSLYIQAKSQYIQTVDALMRAMEARDKYTEGHSQRVSELSVKIAKELKYNDWKTENLKIAALLHDVGKIGVDDRILNKPGRLNSDEYNTIKSHPDLGYNILKDVKNLESVIPIVRNHHERYDGKGYPDGKIGEELSMDVFIVQLADSIDAMATDRPYRKAMSEEQILEEVKINCGTQFHPRVVEAYLSIIEKEKYSCVR